jgi:hypothetical protein
MRQQLIGTEEGCAVTKIATQRTGDSTKVGRDKARCIFGAATLLLALGMAVSSVAVAQTYGNPQTTCALGGTTSISGTVYAPNGTDPLPNILVYIPDSAPSAFVDGPANDTSSSLVTGTPVVETTSANDGTFTLTNVPVGDNVPLVIQAGRWRRQLVINSVTACVNTVISSATLAGEATSRFPQTQLEGDIPKMALATGSADALECTLRKMGIADTEFTDYTVNASGAAHPGRVSLFEGAGGSNSKSGAKAGATVHTEQTLVGSASGTFSGSLLGSYNILLLPCQGESTDYTTADGRSNVITFTNDGGRLFATHLSKYYIDQNSPIDGAANWVSESNPADGTATVQTGFTGGSTLAQWLEDIGSTGTLGQVAISTLRLDQTSVNAPTQSWLTLNVADGSVSVPVMQFSFYTPVGALTADQYGRVMFNEYHVDNTTTSDSVTFPNECTGTMAQGQAMNAQEHMLEYSLFDLMNFAVPVTVPTATITITHAPSTFTGGDKGDTITFDVTNTSETTPIATSPTVTLAISLPAGLTAVAIDDPTNGWNCTLATLTCTLATALPASSSDSVVVSVAVAANVSEGSPSVSATVSSPGFSSSVVSPITLTVALAPANTVTGPANAALANTNVASTASTTVTFAISAGTTLGSIAVVTQGAAGLDFTNAGGGTCAAETYESATTCTVNINFTPTFAGLRLGAALLEDGDGNILATTYLSGLGIGPQIAFSQPTITAPVTGLNQPFGIGFDGHGNLFETDYGSGTIKKFTATSGYATGSTLATSINTPGGMAVDGAGNLFFSSFLGGVVYESALLSNGTYAAKQSIGSGFVHPFGTAVDGNGNVYVADRSNNAVYEITAASGYTTTTSIGSGFSNPYSVALDLSGNVYVANGGSGTLVEITAASGYTTTNTIKTITGIQSATVDANGNVYVAVRNGSTGGVFEILASSGSVSSGSSIATLVSDLVLGPEIVAVAPNGNVFYGTSGGTVISKLDYADAPSLSYASTTVGSSSSAQSVTVENIGNGELTFGEGGLSAPTDYIQVAGSGTPPDCAGSGTVAANATCNLSIEFHPTTSGSLSESFVLTDNSLNTEAGTQSIALSGSGTVVSITLSPTTLPAGTVFSAYSQTLTASGGTGPYTYTVTGLPAGLAFQTSTGRMSGSVSEVGTYPLTVTATDSTDATGSRDYSLVFGQAAGVMLPTSVPDNAMIGGSFTPSVNYIGDGTISLVSNSPGICTVSGSVIHFIAAGVCSVTANAAAGVNYTAVSQTLAFSIARLTPTITIANIPSSAIFGGSFTPSITYNGDGTASVASNSTGTCTVVSGVVHFVGVGTCSLTSSATVGTNYAAIAGTAQTFSIGQATPTISIANIPSSAIFGGNFTPSITYNGDGNSSVASNSAGICTVVSGVVHYVGVGTCSLTSSATVGTNYAAIAGTAQTFSIGQATPTITIANIPSSAIFGGNFTPSITYNGDGISSVASNSTSVCTVASGVVHYVGAGTCSLTASAATGTNYAAVSGTAQTFSIGQATPTITIANIPSTAIFGGNFTPSITYNGDGISSVASNSTGICTVASGVVHFVGVGVCSLTASATVGTNYASIAGTAQTFSIGQATPTITIANIPSTAVYGGNFTPSITYNGDGTSSVASNSTAICTVVSGVVHYVGVGTCSLTASATAGANYAAINGTAQSFTVGQATAIVTLGNLTQMYTGTPLAATATTSPSPLTVLFTYTGVNGTSYGPSSTPPSSVGSYTVVATVSNVDYSGSATGTLVILAPLNLTFSVSGLAFGSVPVGSSSPTLTVILTNPNNSITTITGIAASGDFSASSNCPAIAVAGTCSINVTFAPSATGARTGSLSVSNAGSNSPQIIPLTGTGTQAGIQVSPVLLNFGSQVIASASTGQNITILNTGTANLLLSNVATTGDFSTTGSCATIPAGSNCNLTVVFTPTAAGARTGTVTFTDNFGDGNQTQVVNLTGAGTVAGAQMTPSALVFPSTVVGATSFVLNTKLTNTGTAALTGISITVLGDFNQTNTCAATLAPAATCIVSVKYAPTVAGAETGTLAVSDNLGAQSVSLTGTGLVPGASLNPAQLVFGGQLLKTSSTAQTIVFTNTGNAAVTIASVTPAVNFSDTTNCTGSIAPGSSCSVNVVFAPTTTGSLSGTITIADTAGTQVVTAQGLGVIPGLAVSPSFEIFGAQVVGTISQAQTLTAKNTGTTTLTLSPIVVSSNFTESDQCSATLAPGATCSISLSFSPTSTGALSGSMVVSDTTGAVATLVTLSGQGALPGINASPSTLSFGSLPVGTTSQAQTVTVSNTGSAPLQIGAVSGTGDFAETDNCAAQTIAPGSYCVLNVTMTPTTTGTRTGTIQIDDNADGAHLIALSGVGQQAGVSISPTSLAFGSLPIVSSAQAASAAGTPLSVTITNTGTGTLTLGGLSTQGDFRESNSCGSTIATGSVCTLTVTFAPTALGHRTGTLTITDNAGGGTQLVSLAGDGSPGGLTLSPPVLDYGVQTVGITSQAETAIMANNTGDAIDNLVVTASGEYGQTNNCGSTLANGASCTLHITVTPVTPGAITGTITVAGALVAVNSATAANLPGIRNDATGNGSALSLGVVAVSASAIPPGIGLSIPQVSFNITAVGSPSTGQTITLTNTGTAASLTGLTISGTNIAEFPFTTTCTSTLAAQASCTITIQFTPTQMGLRVGTLNIAANGGISAAVPESGNAVADFTISPVNASSGGASQTILPGGTANYTIAIVPTLGTSFLTPTVLSISGQPANAVASVGTQPWTQLTSTSWQLPANTTLQNLALSFSVPAQTASSAPQHTPFRIVPPILWGILLLPFAARLRRTGKRMARMLSLLLLASAGIAAIATLNGCGTHNGFFGQPQQSYTITVTATTGTLTHSTQVTLTVQ